jgi:hypothetical protein
MAFAVHSRVWLGVAVLILLIASIMPDIHHVTKSLNGPETAALIACLAVGVVVMLVAGFDSTGFYPHAMLLAGGVSLASTTLTIAVFRYSRLLLTGK